MGVSHPVLAALLCRQLLQRFAVTGDQGLQRYPAAHFTQIPSASVQPRTISVTRLCGRQVLRSRRISLPTASSPDAGAYEF